MKNNCTRDFKVVLNISKNEVEEGESVNMSCCHHLPKEHILSYTWMMNKTPVHTGNTSFFFIEKTVSDHKGLYTCAVHSLCGNYTSGPQSVTISSKKSHAPSLYHQSYTVLCSKEHNATFLLQDNRIIILVICGCSALALVIIMGLSMKIKMHRDKVKNKQRADLRQQAMRRAQNLQNGGLPPTPTKAP
ncbi:unnamed protein product [Knipowitschia caucasica]|uniref:Ig-like domain-containing protein n=1 Tax=Knipowitschia caucasica TaxID=637954 RepID=A0AAV2MJL9_KNICA